MTFLVPVEATTVSEILENYDRYAGLDLVSDYFDASRTDLLPRRDLLILTVELTAKPVQNIQRSIEKTIFRPDQQISFNWPPYRCNFKEGSSKARLTRAHLRINKYVNRHKGFFHTQKMKEKLRVDNRMLTEGQTKEFLEYGFEIEDKEKAIHRFELQLRSKLELDRMELVRGSSMQPISRLIAASFVCITLFSFTPYDISLTEAKCGKAPKHGPPWPSWPAPGATGPRGQSVLQVPLVPVAEEQAQPAQRGQLAGGREESVRQVRSDRRVLPALLGGLPACQGRRAPRNCRG